MRQNQLATAVSLPETSRLSERLRFRCASQSLFAIGVSLVWLLFYNVRFWHETFLAMWRPSSGAALFIASLFVLVLSVQAVLLLLIPGRTLLRWVVGALFIVASLSSYFSDTYGVVVNRDMVNNIFETDTLEVAALLNAGLLTYLVFLGILPAWLVWRVDMPAPAWRTQLRERLLFLAGGVALSFLALFACSANYAVFLREYKPIRFLISPGSMVVGATNHVADLLDHSTAGPLANPGGALTRVSTSNAKRPLLLFLVVGETARAANFQLGGYPRATNPRLMGENDLVYFQDTESCGTSTSISLPCMFSHLGRARYEKQEASRNINLLDMLSQSGVDVEWRDNNSGCKGVCARVQHVEFAKGSNAYDEVMLTGLQERLRTLKRDTVIVFHQVGSHGPAYSERYPPAFEVFKPACRSNELDRCTRAEVVNAYDNTILYTDHNLAEQIELLRSMADRADTALLYVSDHGESLGEQGMYLHGMPYAFAPETQKRVPFFLWTSDSYRRRTGLQQSCLQTRAKAPMTHDNVFHTVMGAFGVRNAVYNPRLDIISSCEQPVPTLVASDRSAR